MADVIENKWRICGISAFRVMWHACNFTLYKVSAVPVSVSVRVCRMREAHLYYGVRHTCSTRE